VLCEQWSDAVRVASRALDISTEYEFPRGAGTALVCRGRALTGESDAQRGRREIQEGLDVLRRADLTLGSSLLFAFQAGAFLDSTAWIDGLKAVENGLAVCRDTSERLFESELWRLKSELLLVHAHGQPETPDRLGGDEEADQCLAKAVAIARAQGARALEDRAEETRRRSRRETRETRSDHRATADPSGDRRLSRH
jgi:hypothetical protein